MLNYFVLIQGFRYSFNEFTEEVKKASEAYLCNKISLDGYIQNRLPKINQFDVKNENKYVIMFDEDDLKWVIIGKPIYRINVNLLNMTFDLTNEDRKGIMNIYKKLNITPPNSEDFCAEYGLFYISYKDFSDFETY